MKDILKTVTLSLASLFALNLSGCAVNKVNSSTYGVNTDNNAAVVEVITHYVVLNTSAANSNIYIRSDHKNSITYQNIKQILQSKGYAVVEKPSVNDNVITLKYHVSPIASNALSIVIDLNTTQAVGAVFLIENTWKPYTRYTVRGK